MEGRGEDKNISRQWRGSVWGDRVMYWHKLSHTDTPRQGWETHDWLIDRGEMEASPRKGSGLFTARPGYPVQVSANKTDNRWLHCFRTDGLCWNEKQQQHNDYHSDVMRYDYSTVRSILEMLVVVVAMRYKQTNYNLSMAPSLTFSRACQLPRPSWQSFCLSHIKIIFHKIFHPQK